jgi:GWxTD domain-containing protein
MTLHDPHRRLFRASARRHRWTLGALLLGGLVVWLGTASAEGGKTALRELTARWQKARSQDMTLAAALRPLAAADSSFRADTTGALARLSPELRQAYDGLHYLLDPDLQQQFLGLSSDSLRAEWLRRYWRLRDPSPTTQANERLATHLERVAAAREQFPWKGHPGWDDRGAIWIQFGAPDSVIEEAPSVEEGLGFVPGHLEWLYLRERWVVEFERPNPRGPWHLGKSSATLSYRPDLVARDRQRLGYDVQNELPTPSAYEREGDLLGLADERTLLAKGGMSAERLDNDIVQHEIRTDLRAKELLQKRTDGLMRFRKEYAAGHERFSVEGAPKAQLWYVFDVDAFKGPPGRTRLEVHYQVDLQDLKYTWQDSVYVAGYRAEGVLLDASIHTAARDEYTENVRAADFRSTLASQLVPGQLVFNVPPGSYRLAMRITDINGASEGAYTTWVEAPRLDGDKLALSDVQMASSIVFADDSWPSRFVKHDRLVVPNPIKVYRKGRQLTGYYEIYGLQLDASRVCHYEVRYTIEPRSLKHADGWFPPAEPEQQPYVSARFADEGGASDLFEELRVDVGALASDTYDLVLTVKDLTSGAQATSRTSFALLD